MAKAKDFKLKNQDEKDVKLSDFKGKWTVLYFYPKDDTSGCTIEAIEFTNNLNQFKKENAEVIGISPDSVKSHCDFRDKHKLKVTLLCDPEKKVLEKYGVWKEKSMYGRKYLGVERTTYLIDPEGNIAYVWNKVNPQGHAEEVLRKIKELKK